MNLKIRIRAVMHLSMLPTSRFIHIANSSMWIKCVDWRDFIFRTGINIMIFFTVLIISIVIIIIIINAVVDWVPLIFWVFTLCLTLQA